MKKKNITNRMGKGSLREKKDNKQISPSDGAWASALSGAATKRGSPAFFHFRAGNFHFRAQPSRFRA